RRSAIAPANDDATQLSRQGKVQEGLIPRLRALDVLDEHKDSATFDEQSFQEEEPQPEREPEHVADTADLLEALRRKRGQREAPRVDPEPETDSSPSRPVAILGSVDDDESVDEPESDESADSDSSSNANDASKRRRRPSMP